MRLLISGLALLQVSEKHSVLTGSAFADLPRQRCRLWHASPIHFLIFSQSKTHPFPNKQLPHAHCSLYIAIVTYVLLCGHLTKIPLPSPSKTPTPTSNFRVHTGTLFPIKPNTLSDISSLSIIPAPLMTLYATLGLPPPPPPRPTRHFMPISRPL